MTNDMPDDRLKLWLGFVKFLLGTFVLGLVSTLINSAIQEREIELKEQEQIGQFLTHALNEDVGVRQRFAHYFKTVTRSQVLRERWTAYSDLVDKEYQEAEAEKQRLEDKVNKETNALEKEKLLSRIADLEQALSPTPPVLDESVPPRVYFHIRTDAQRDRAKQIAAALTQNGFQVPGIQRLDDGPRQTELRYFRQRDTDEAQAIVSHLRAQNVEVNLSYVRGYETSRSIRPRHFELWFSPSSLK